MIDQENMPQDQSSPPASSSTGLSLSEARRRRDLARQQAASGTPVQNSYGEETIALRYPPVVPYAPSAPRPAEPVAPPKPATPPPAPKSEAPTPAPSARTPSPKAEPAWTYDSRPTPSAPVAEKPDMPAPVAEKPATPPPAKSADSGAVAPTPQEKKSSNPTVVILVSALCVCLVAIVCLCVFLLRSPGNEVTLESIPTSYVDREEEYIYIPMETESPTVIYIEPETVYTWETEPPTTEPTTVYQPHSYAYLDELNQKHNNYFDFQPDENGYVISSSSSRYISSSDLNGMTEHQVCMARNEIYARHGYIFQTEMYNDYFSNFSWYTPISRTLPDLNDYESENVKTISAYESERGW